MIQILDEFLKRKNLKYEDLTSDERQVYMEWLKALEGKALTLDDLKSYISRMKSSVAAQLADTKEADKEANLLLKARLKNYILLEEMLSGPDRARKALEAYMRGQAESVDNA